MMERYIIFFLIGWLAREYINRVLDINIKVKSLPQIKTPRLRRNKNTDEDDQDQEVIFDD